MQEKEYPFPDSDLSEMLEDLLKCKMIELPEMKHPEEAGRVDDPSYCKYHRLLGHPVEKCFVLKEKIMELARKGLIELDFDKATTNLTTAEIVDADPINLDDEAIRVWERDPKPADAVWVEAGNCSKAYWVTFTPPSWSQLDIPIVPTGWGDDEDQEPHPTNDKARIQFGSFDSMEIQHALPTPFETVVDMPAETKDVHQQETATEDNDHHCPDEEGWILVAHRRRHKSSSPKSPLIKLRRVRERLTMIKKRQEEKAPRKKKAIYAKPGEVHEQMSRAPVTLWEFLPKKLQQVDDLIMSCYAVHCDEDTTDVDHEESSSQELHDEETSSPQNHLEVSCMSEITFTDDDLMLGSEIHNRPLFVSGYANEQQVNRILLDGGSAVNILPARVMKQLGISADELSPSNLMIQGFNQGGQRAIGKLRLQLLIEDMVSSPLLHVIESRTPYNMLLGRPWLHENRVVPSTLHQCFKYIKDGVERKIDADDKPFTEAESYYADAKFYVVSDQAKETLQVPTKSPILKKEGKKEKPSEKEGEQRTELNDQVLSRTTPTLRYIPKSKRKAGQSPFMDSDSDPTTLDAFKELTLPVTSLMPMKLEKEPLKGFTRPSQSPAIEHGDLPKSRSQGFDPNAYKLLAKAGFNLKQQTSSAKFPLEIMGEKAQPLTATQQRLKEQGYGVGSSRAGIGFTASPPLRWSIKKTSIQYITAKEADEGSSSVTLPSRVSVFDRIGHLKARRSVFDRLGTQKKINSYPRMPVHTRLGTTRPSSLPKVKKQWRPKVSLMEDPEKFHSLVPSRMNREITCKVVIGEALKVKRCTMVRTNQVETSSRNAENDMVEESTTSS